MKKPQIVLQIGKEEKVIALLPTLPTNSLVRRAIIWKN